MSATRDTEPVPAAKSLTIGAVCKSLEREFPDISISKIRYLEDQKLLAPRRTAGGYRLFSPTDVARLRTILRLQRDEFLPLRVIRQELAAGRSEEELGEDRPTSARRCDGRPSTCGRAAARPSPWSRWWRTPARTPSSSRSSRTTA